MNGPPSGAFDLVGEILAGKYRIDRHLGRGGMGIVYAATQLELSRKVAVKVLTTSGGDLDALGREARAAAQLAHPHIVQVTDFVGRGDKDDDPPFLVMELLEGESLDERLSKKKTLPADAAVQIAIQVLSALEAAHAAGIIHRDVKPANIFLTRTAVTYDFVKLLDFGVARVGAGSSIASLNARGPIGTPAYMAPEQIAEGRADARTDVYAVGVCLYEMLAGEPPFLAANVPSLLQKICSADAAPLSQRGTGAEDALLAIIEKAMSKDPKARFASAEELRAALVPFAHAVAVPSRNIAGAPSEQATLRATSESASTLESPPVEPEPAPSSEKLVEAAAPPPPPPPPPRRSSGADKTVRSSEPQNATLASHDPLTTTPAPSLDRPRASAMWPLAGLCAIVGGAWFFGAKAPAPRPREPSHAATPATTCTIRPSHEPFVTDAAHLSVAARHGFVTLAGEDVGGGAFALIAAAGERTFQRRKLFGNGPIQPAGAVAIAARDRVGFVGVRTFETPDSAGNESVIVVADQDREVDSTARGRRLMNAQHTELRPSLFDAVGMDALVLFAAGGPTRAWTQQHRRLLGPDAALPPVDLPSFFLVYFDDKPYRVSEERVSDEPTTVRAFAGAGIRGAVYRTDRIHIEIAESSGAGTIDRTFEQTTNADHIGVGAFDGVATIAWTERDSRGPVHWARMDSAGMTIEAGEVLRGRDVGAWALGNTRAGLVFAWVSTSDAEGWILHVGMGASLREAVLRAGTLQVARETQLVAVSQGESDPVVAWKADLRDRPQPALHTATIGCE